MVTIYLIIILNLVLFKWLQIVRFKNKFRHICVFIVELNHIYVRFVDVDFLLVLNEKRMKGYISKTCRY